MTRDSTSDAPGWKLSLSERVRTFALSAGFDAVGILRSEVLRPERDHFLKWVEAGNNGEMKWITPEWVNRATDPRELLPSALTIVCVAMSYSGRPAGPTPAGHGRIARYADGPDYHSVIRDRLVPVASFVEEMGGATRIFVDTAPTMDKALATRAGLGWQGRNTNILSRELGSFTFLGGIVTDLDLTVASPYQGGCGACRLCVVACPTGALKGDYTIDARLCISYLTIEHRGSIPRELRPLIGDWVFGCDICQDVCPPVGRIQDGSFPSSRQSRLKYTKALAKKRSKAPA